MVMFSNQILIIEIRLREQRLVMMVSSTCNSMKSTEKKIFVCLDYTPSPSPSIKRKHVESSVEHVQQMNDITNCLKTVLKQQEAIVDSIQALRKSQEKLQKTTNSLFNANKYVSFFIFAFFYGFYSIYRIKSRQTNQFTYQFT